VRSGPGAKARAVEPPPRRRGRDRDRPAAQRLDREERRRAVQERVGVVEVVGAHRQLVAVDRVVDADRRRARRIDRPRRLVGLDRRERPVVVAGRAQVAQVAGVVADEVAARAPRRQRDLDRPLGAGARDDERDVGEVVLRTVDPDLVGEPWRGHVAKVH
jgi:hypothetical protein